MFNVLGVPSTRLRASIQYPVSNIQHPALRFGAFVLDVFGVDAQAGDLLAQEHRVHADPPGGGGDVAILQHVVYPEEAKDAGIEGQVIVQAFITKEGKTGAVKLLKNETGAPILGEAAMAAIRPVTWEPARQKGTPVGVWISVPVNFRLSEGEK